MMTGFLKTSVKQCYNFMWVMHTPTLLGHILLLEHKRPIGTGCFHTFLMSVCVCVCLSD